MAINIAYYLILGKPLIFWTGILTLLLFILTAIVGFLNFHGNHRVSFKWHPRLVVISFILAIIHGGLGLLIYFKF